MRLIDADELIKELHRRYEEPEDLHYDEDWYAGIITAEVLVDGMPTIEAERKKGKWVDDGCDTRCGECGEKQEFPHWQFCPNCGTDMRG